MKTKIFPKTDNALLRNKKLNDIIKLSNDIKKCWKDQNKMGKKRKLFCEYGPIAYKISLFKEAKKKDFIDFKNGKKFAKKKNKENFEYIWKGDTKVLLRKLHGVDMRVTKK